MLVFNQIQISEFLKRAAEAMTRVHDTIPAQNTLAIASPIRKTWTSQLTTITSSRFQWRPSATLTRIFSRALWAADTSYPTHPTSRCACSGKQTSLSAFTALPHGPMTRMLYIVLSAASSCHEYLKASWSRRSPVNWAPVFTASQLCLSIQAYVWYARCR